MANYIYTWHDRRYNAIKLGSSADPEQRMLNYGLALNLNPRVASLRSVKLAQGTPAKLVLMACHVALKALRLLPIMNLTELYGLRDQDYNVVSTAVLRAALVAETELMKAINDNDDMPTTTNAGQ